MENITNNTEVTAVEPTTKKEWVKPEMVEIEVMIGIAGAVDAEGTS